MEYLKESPPDTDSRWNELMELAIMQARQAGKNGEIPVGAILLDSEGRIIGKGYNQSISRHDPSAHAEVIAIQQGCQNKANYRLLGSTLIVTLEPCIMCLGAIIHARIATVVYGANDPKTGCLASRMNGANIPWANHSFEVVSGISAARCGSLLSDFFQQRRQQKRQKKQPSNRP